MSQQQCASPGRGRPKKLLREGQPGSSNENGASTMKIRHLLGIAIMAGTVFAGGHALTDSNSLPATSVVKGYGSQTITGVTATAVNYNTNTAGDTITSVGLVLTGDTTTKVI